MIHILVAGDQPLTHTGIHTIRKPQPGLAIAGDARDEQESVEQGRSLHSDVVLVDIRPPALDGMAAIRETVGLGRDCAEKRGVLMLRTADDQAYEAPQVGVSDIPVEEWDTGALTSLVGLAAERILLADKVAAAKFGTSTPIEDPVREQQLLDQAAGLAVEAGVDPEDTVEFFRAQIEVSKLVQRGLYDLWTRHPELAPTERPDLATEVRPQLDRITTAFIEQLAASAGLRGPTMRCFVSLIGDALTTLSDRGAYAPCPWFCIRPPSMKYVDPVT